MADHGKSLGVVEKTLFFFERFALLVALLIPEAKDLALLCVLIANLVYFTVCCITLDDHVASLFPFVMREYPFWIKRLAFFLVSVSTNSHWQRYSYWERCIGVGLFVFTNAVYTYMMIFMDFKDFGSSCWSLCGSSNNNPTNEETNKGEELEEPENKSDVEYEELLKPDDQNSGSNRVKEDEDTLYLHVETSKGEKLIEDKAKMENDPHTENKDDDNNDSSGMELFDAEFHEFMLRTLKLVFRVAVASIPVIAPGYFNWHSTISFFFAYALFLLHFPIEHRNVVYRADEVSIAFLGICYICGSLFLGVVAYGLYILTQLVCFIYLSSDSRLIQKQKIVSHAFRVFSSNSKEGEKVEGPLEGQTTNKDEPPQGDQEAAAEDKANNKWEEDFLWSKTALDFKTVEQSWEDDDICEESWEADDPSDCSISNDWQQECGDMLDKKEYNWKNLIFKRKLKDEGFEHNQPHHALIKQLKQLEHDNNTLAAKVHAYEEDSLKWEGQKNNLIEKLNATRISREQISHCYVNLNKDYNDLLKKFNATNTAFKHDEQLKWKEEKNMITANLDEATKSLEKYQGIANEFDEQRRKWEEEKNELDALIEELNATRISREQISHCYVNLNKDYNDLLKKFNATNTAFKHDEQLKWKEEKNMITAKLDEATKSLEKYQGIANEFDEQRRKWEEEKNELDAAKTYWYQAYLKLSYASNEKFHVINESPESYKAHLLESEEICNKLMDKNAMLAAKLIVETSSAEYFQKLVHEFEEKCRVLEAEKNDLNAKLFTAMASNELYKSLLRNFDCH